jgi:hypothetical protein
MRVKQKKDKGGIMLKKVMIICLALSFVFIGGIGISLAGDCDGTQKHKTAGPGPHGAVGPGDGSCNDFISHASSIIIAAQERAQNGHGPGPAPSSGDSESEGPEWPLDFIDNDSSTILAGNCNPTPIGDGPFGPKGPKGPLCPRG